MQRPIGVPQACPTVSFRRELPLSGNSIHIPGHEILPHIYLIRAVAFSAVASQTPFVYPPSCLSVVLYLLTGWAGAFG